MWSAAKHCNNKIILKCNFLLIFFILSSYLHFQTYKSNKVENILYSPKHYMLKRQDFRRILKESFKIHSVLKM